MGMENDCSRKNDVGTETTAPGSALRLARTWGISNSVKNYFLNGFGKRITFDRSMPRMIPAE